MRTENLPSLRSELAINLYQPNTYTTSPLNLQTVYKSLPTGVRAFIMIHQRMLINSTLLNSMVPLHFCFQCTILHEGGTEHERYTRTAFQLGWSITKHITNNKHNIVISQLKTLSGGLVLCDRHAGRGKLLPFAGWHIISSGLALKKMSARNRQSMLE
jgi:hypothetical protein